MIQLQETRGEWVEPIPLPLPAPVTVIQPIHNLPPNRICACGNLKRSKGRRNGRIRYASVCDSCRNARGGWIRKRARKVLLGETRIRKTEAKSCSLCGWVGPCDFHRIIAGKDGGKYVWSNIAILCPNCHRLHHRGLLRKELIPCERLMI